MYVYIYTCIYICIYIIGEITSGGAKQYLIYLRDNWYWLCNVKVVSIFLVETMQSQEVFYLSNKFLGETYINLLLEI